MRSKYNINCKEHGYPSSKEIGGDFEWAGILTGPFLTWPSNNIWFSLGRDALLALWKFLKCKNSNNTLFLPDYFCQEVMAFWLKKGVIIKIYADNPQWSHPDWDTLNPMSSDLVLAVNYFGIRDGKVWHEWHKKRPSVILIEDHTHDPFSKWAISSKANYCFASIRKIFPIPDGAILWSPVNALLPNEPENKDWLGSSLKLAAMIYKKDYLDSPASNKGIKETYRRFQEEGERMLSQREDVILSPWSHSLVETGYPKVWRRRREKNVHLLLDLIKGCRHLKPLFSKWPQGHCPFNVVLLFESELLRETFRQKIIAQGIYTPIHWSFDSGENSHATELSKKILTIPVDQRYNTEDIYFIASIINKLDDTSGYSK